VPGGCGWGAEANEAALRTHPPIQWATAPRAGGAAREAGGERRFRLPLAGKGMG
jgi:hypothetical protein